MGAAVEVLPDRSAAWRLAWLTPGRCRLILALVLAAGFLSHLHYLLGDCPMDLSGDEAYYWDWSRKLDLCYYSKGPMVAYLIRPSCAIFGDTMPAVRFPALVLAVGTSLLTYWLTWKLFGSEKLALGAVLLNHLVPMFIAGSIMMTIDPPLYFLWAAATALAAKAIWDGARWAWVGMGAAVGLGFLTKFSMPLWLVGLGLFLAIDRESRRWLKTRWPWIMVAVALVFTIPVIVFNVQHGAVSVKHVSGDVGGTGKSGFSPLGPLEFLATQFGMLGPALFVIMAGAVGYVVCARVVMIIGCIFTTKTRRHEVQLDDRVRLGNATARLENIRDALLERAEKARNRFVASCLRGLGSLASAALRSLVDPRRRQMLFLTCLGGSFFAFVFIASTFTKAQGNWAAPAYFSLMILSAYFISTRMRDIQSWRRWRGWVWAAVIIGVVCIVVMHDMQMLYRPVAWVGKKIGKKEIPPRTWDVSFRLRGWGDLGDEVSRQMQDLHDPMVIAEKYEFTAELAFYVKGQPKAICMGTWFTNPQRRWRMSQYDLWPDRRLDNKDLLGRDAIFVGYGLEKHPDQPPAELTRAFRSIEPVRRFDVVRRGIVIRTFNIWRCHDFRQPMIWPGEEQKH